MDITKQQFLNRVGYQFKDPALLDLALTHRSYGAHNNERLEFLGDAALNFITGHAIYQRLPDVREGELSRYRSNLVKGVTLTEIANELQLSEHLHLGAGEMKSGGHHRASILADTVEAIIGSIYLDGGMSACESSVLQWFETRLDNLEGEGLKDPKTQLQEFMQARSSALPVYEVASVSGEEHNQQFTVHCKVDGLKQPTIGHGNSRRHAEKQAAEKALKGLIK